MICFFCSLTAYYLMYCFYHSSVLNSENKPDSTASSVSMKDVVREEDDEEGFLEELSENDDDDNE